MKNIKLLSKADLFKMDLETLIIHKQHIEKKFTDYCNLLECILEGRK